MPRNAICFQSPKFKKGETELLREMKLAPTTAVRTAATSAAATQAMSPSQRPPAPPPPAALASQVDDLFGNDFVDIGGPTRSQLLGGVLPQQVAASLRPSSNMLGMSAQAASGPIDDNSFLQARAANLLALERNQIGLLPREDLSSFLADPAAAAAAARFSGRAALPTRQMPAMASTDSVRQNALRAMMQREQLMQQFQAQQRQLQQLQQPLSSRLGPGTPEDLLLRTLAPANMSGADAIATLRLRQLQDAQRQVYAAAAAARVVGPHAAVRQNLGEAKQDPDPPDALDDLVAYLRQNRR